MSNYERGTARSLASVNDELEKIQNAIEDKLDRLPDSGQPNSMSTDLDMNSKRIYNLPDKPLTSSEAVSRKYLESVALEGIPVNIGSDKTYNTLSNAVSDTTLSVGEVTSILGYNNLNDKSESKYTVVASGTGTDDGGRYIDLDNGNQLSLILESPLDISAWGAVTENTDISNELQKAVDVAVANDIGEVKTTLEKVKILNPVDMKGVNFIGSKTEIVNTTNLNNVGEMTGFIVRGYPVGDDRLGDISTGGLHQKLIYRESAQRLSVFMKRRGKGYLKIEHYYNSFTSGPSDEGGACENWRSAVTSWASDVMLYKHNADDETSSAWGSSTVMPVSVSFPSGTVTAKQLEYRSTNTLNAEIAYNFDADRIGQIGYIALFSTGGSANSVELYVNGTLQKTFSATLTTGNELLLIPYEATQNGTNEVRLKKIVGGSLNVIGAEFSYLDEYDGKRTIDSVAFGDYDKDYVPGSGAQDYAFYSPATSKFFGSIHGGETERLPPELFLDGEKVTIPAVTGDFETAYLIKLFQKTRIETGADFMAVDSTYTYYEDSYQRLDIAMTGSATVNIAYTCMTPTNETFDTISWPMSKILDVGKNTVGRYNMVTQLNNTTKQRLTTKCTLFRMGGETGANMGANGPYISRDTGKFCKFYYGPVLDSETNLTRLAYTTERLYE